MDVLERVPSFGKEIRESLFYLDREAALTNHGSWGTVPKPVFEAQVALMKEVDTHPDSWYRRKISPRYFQAIESVAKFIDAPPKTVVLLENATTAVNVILRSLSLGEGDGVLITSLTYGACSNAAKAVCKQTGATLHILEIKLPVVSKEAVVDLYRKYLDDHPDVKFALVDQITSPSAILMPVKEIASLYQSRGVRVMVDGAHSPGQVRLSMREMGADYFTGNLHKWMFSPRGCAFLYVREGLEDNVNPLVVSHNHFLSYQERFVQQGTRDYTPYCTAPVALEFYDKIGGLPAISSYNCGLLAWATELLCKRWGTDPLPIPADMKAPFLSVVKLPECLGPPTIERKDELQEMVFHTYNVQTVFDIVDGQLWCRFCAQVYNVKEDYKRLADAVAEIIENTSH